MAQKTPDILKKIVARKQEEIAESTKRLPIEKMIELANSADTPRGFFNSLNKKVKERQSGIIAEIKKASPSKGVLRENFEPVEIAQSYEDGGASCLSILTDRDFFQGDPLYLIKARASVSIPVIRKDFIIEPYQVYESRAMGADCILLIVSCLNDDEMKHLSDLAISLNFLSFLHICPSRRLKRCIFLRCPPHSKKK